MNESAKSGTGTDDVYVPTLKWFTLYHNIMKDKYLTPNESQSNLKSSNVSIEEIASAVDECTSQTSKDAQDTIKQETEAVKKPVYSRKRNIKCLESLVNKVKAVGEMVQTPIINNENEFCIYGRSVAAQLNAMPLMLALQAQSHIQNYLTSLRMHSIANPLNLQSYSPSPPSNTTYISSPSTINNSVSLDNNSTVNLQAYSPTAASPPTYHIPSSPIDSNNNESTVVGSNDLHSDILELAIINSISND